jgi:hypothetical protein
MWLIWNKMAVRRRMFDRFRVPNPHYPGAPVRMNDGRLFTDYRPNCLILGSVDDKEEFQAAGENRIYANRSTAVMIAGSVPRVDTMVPELTKRVCRWDGCVTVMNEPIGIGQGRAMGTPPMPDIFSSNPKSYVMWPTNVPVAKEVKTRNRYSAPYGN